MPAAARLDVAYAIAVEDAVAADRAAAMWGHEGSARRDLDAHFAAAEPGGDTDTDDGGFDVPGDDSASVVHLHDWVRQMGGADIT